ncbi:SIRB2 protein, partial [Polypterus senegalus]
MSKRYFISILLDGLFAAPVSTPEISLVSSEIGSCTFNCSVENGTQVSVSWYKGDILWIKKSPVSLTLKLEETEFNDPFTCVARNDVSAENSTVMAHTICEGFKVSQPQSPMEGVESSNVTLICDVSSETPLGPLRWYRAAGSERTHFYSGAPKGGDKNDRRVTWAVENPTVNYSITIRDLRVSDTGEYYCVKYTKADENKPNAPPHATGPGVSLTVKEFVNQSQGSVDAVVGSNVTLLCLLSSPLLKGPVKWMKKTSNGKKHIYSSLSSGTEKNDSRVTWTEAKPTVNFSITIRSVQLNDTGTYYCEKYKDGDMNTPFKAKEGVQLNVKDVQEDWRRACPGYVGGFGYRAWKPSPVGTCGHRQAAPRCLSIPGAQHFRHTRKCWGEDNRGHPDGFWVCSRHFRHTRAWLRRNAGKQLEPIRVPI